ncbi:hypothetical protein SAY87_029055 [Trapa incisa]|uniref:Uncharacterized protein n=1 Tax=Trapa incisa TaxID=236973 RepID=A0AAN7L3H6_9MYRT|nr:hypothetical protein SAY87_029055 [Trapa incisa]
MEATVSLIWYVFDEMPLCEKVVLSVPCAGVLVEDESDFRERFVRECCCRGGESPWRAS